MRVQSVFGSLYLTLATLQSMYIHGEVRRGEALGNCSIFQVQAILYVGMPAMGLEFGFDSIACNECNAVYAMKLIANCEFESVNCFVFYDDDIKQKTIKKQLSFNYKYFL